MLSWGIITALGGILLAYVGVVGIRTKEITYGRWQIRTVKRKVEPIGYWFLLAVIFSLMVTLFAASFYHFSTFLS